MRIFVPTIVPATLTEAPNHLAACLNGPDDIHTWGHVTGTREGVEYGTRNLLVAPVFLQMAGSPLERPEWDTDEMIDMDKAQQAQAAITMIQYDGETPLPTANPDTIFVIVGAELETALAAWGLDAVPDEEDLL